jgi:hypothetical protein
MNEDEYNAVGVGVLGCFLFLFFWCLEVGCFGTAQMMLI